MAQLTVENYGRLVTTVHFWERQVKRFERRAGKAKNPSLRHEVRDDLAAAEEAFAVRDSSNFTLTETAQAGRRIARLADSLVAAESYDRAKEKLQEAKDALKRAQA